MFSEALMLLVRVPNDHLAAETFLFCYLPRFSLWQCNPLHSHILILLFLYFWHRTLSFTPESNYALVCLHPLTDRFYFVYKNPFSVPISRIPHTPHPPPFFFFLITYKNPVLVFLQMAILQITLSSLPALFSVVSGNSQQPWPGESAYWRWINEIRCHLIAGVWGKLVSFHCEKL